MIRGLVVTHGDIAESLVVSLSHFLGEVEELFFLSSDGYSAKELSEKIESLVSNHNAIIFTDLPGAAPTTRARSILKTNQCVISGVNMGMLISFAMKRNTLSQDELVELLVNDAKRSVEMFCLNS